MSVISFFGKVGQRLQGQMLPGQISLWWFSIANPIPYGGGGGFSPPQTDIANYGVFALKTCYLIIWLFI